MATLFTTALDDHALAMIAGGTAISQVIIPDLMNHGPDQPQIFGPCPNPDAFPVPAPNPDANG